MAFRVVEVGDPDEVVDVLSEAFRDYPVMRFVLGRDRADYERDLRTLVGFFVMSRALRGEYLFGVRAEENPERLEAAAIVSRPGTPTPPPLASLREKVWESLGVDARSRYQTFADATSPFLPSEPHLHLNMIGVRRGLQGTGRGRSLLDHVHELSRNDPRSSGISLSTENHRNVALYQHAGYVLRGHAIVSPELETWALYRED